MLKNYFKIAIRNLRHNRTYSIMNMLGLGLGIAGAVLIFLFLRYHLSTDRHQSGFGRIYRVVLDLHLDEGTEHESGSAAPMAPTLLRDYPQVEKAGFMSKMPNMTLAATDNKKTTRFLEKTNVVLADQGFMEMFTFDWLSPFDPHQMTEPATVVISEKIARKYFGETAVTGKVLRMNNAHDLRIIGVVKDQKHPTDLDFEVYISLPTIKQIDPAYDMSSFSWISSRNFTFVRFAKNTDVKKIHHLLKTNGPKFYGAEAKYYEHQFQPLADIHFDERYDGKIRRSILWILAGVGTFLLVIACINFINLATAQALKRAKEIGVRKVLGSTQQQLFWQFMSETALITLASSLLTLLFITLSLPAMNNWTQTKAYQFGQLFQSELAVFWLVTLLVIVILAGFYPAVIISGFNPIHALKGKLGNKQVGGIGLRRSLITVQLVIAQVLVIGTLILLLQLKFFKNADLGFDQHAIVTLSLPKTESAKKVSQSFRNELMQNPDVKSVSYQYEAPTSAMGYGGSVRFDNRSEWEKFVIRDRFADQHYLETYRMPLLAGRSPVDRDSVTEFVINEELMRRLGIQDPQKMLGRQLEDGNTGFKGPIVGVVKSFHLKSLQDAVEPCAIFANSKLYKEVAIKLDTRDFSKSLKTIQNAWQKIYPDEVFEYQFVDEKIARFYQKEEQLTTLIQSFAIIAIFICCLGLYGMVSFMVSQRTKEIGVRKVLGAGVHSIVLLFGKEFLQLVCLSCIIATPVAWYIMNNWLNNFAYRINLHWWLMASGGLIILLITLLTVGYKVVRAALMNPVKSLKIE
ncbi:FtsX-like permease family protein [Dyadobacter sp. LHD-138]|uniref:FtsX-like permease family protein n=1 Tax=Dyadobacter sp. LHD-138 TaxID=3071413 RepID=UPI0027E0642D|nr:FtsX-like permease family protein [Dyadobacter sp. LHD-138]MDQ6479264.1 FtsX-like permease family protein [Dyadobacter sp. LHD-138]